MKYKSFIIFLYFGYMLKKKTKYRNLAIFHYLFCFLTSGKLENSKTT